VAKMLIDARIAKGLSQKELANLIGTKQPSIARIEKGENLPSLSLLQKIAEAMHTYLIPPKFAFMLEVKEVDSKVTHVTQQETVIRVIHEHVIRDETKFAYSI